MLIEFWKAVRGTETWRLVVSLEVGLRPAILSEWEASANECR